MDDGWTDARVTALALLTSQAALKRAIKEKYRLWKVYKQTGNETDYNQCKEQRNRTQATIKRAQWEYEQDLIKRFKSQPKLSTNM